MEFEDRVIRAKKGDDNAFQEIIQVEKLKLYRTAYAYVKNEADALDIVHDTVYKAYISIHTLKNPAFFSTWLTRILVNCAIDYIKRQKRVVLKETNDIAQSHSYNESMDDKIMLIDAIEQLEEKYKTIVILKYFKDLSNQQIADVLGYPIGTVKAYLHRALKRLHMELKEGDLDG